MTESDVQLALLPEAGPLRVSRETYLCFEIGGQPRAWSRARAQIRYTKTKTPFIHWFLDSEESNYRDCIRWHAKGALRGRPPTSAPIALLIHAFLAIPPSWHWKEKQAARNGAILPDAKPDADNYLKIVGDSLNGVAWRDDAQIIDSRCIKRFSDKPALRIEIREFLPPK